MHYQTEELLTKEVLAKDLASLLTFVLLSRTYLLALPNVHQHSCPDLPLLILQYTNDLFGIAASGWIGTTINQYNTIQYDTIYSIVMSQAIGYKRIPKFISSGWDVFKRLSITSIGCGP